MYKLAPGNRVLWHSESQEIRATIDRVWKHKAKILTIDFEKITVPLDELELAPIREQGYRDFDLDLTIEPEEAADDCVQNQSPPFQTSSITPPVIEPHGCVATYLKKGKSSYRYSYRQDGRVRHVHIRGGCVGSPESDSAAMEVRGWISNGATANEIVRLLRRAV